jgi:hypothetical protein
VADIICTNETCAEYLIRKEAPDDIDPSTVMCGTCGETLSSDEGEGVDEADRPNPDEPLVLPDPNG